MASTVITTTQEEDQAIKAASDKYNAKSAPLPPETATQFFRRVVAQRIAGWVAENRQTKELNRGQLFNRASAAEQASIDAILAPYQN